MVLGDDATVFPPDQVEEILIAQPAETVRWLRERLGISQLQLALRLHVSLSTVTKWEQGVSGMRPRTRRRVAAVLEPLLATPQGCAWRATLVQNGAKRPG